MLPSLAHRDALLSKRNEQRLIKAGQRVLLEGEYPNPERVGCPGEKVLKAIAFRDMPLKDALDDIDHMGYCSPCFIEHTEFRKQAQPRRTLELVFASVALVAIIVGGVWLWKAHRFPEFGRKPSVAAVIPVHRDLKNWPVFRGEQPPGAHRGPIQLPRERLDMTTLLPLGSEAGNYTVQASTELRQQLVTATGPAVIRKDGVAALKVKPDASKLKPGMYALSIGGIGSEPHAYPLGTREAESAIRPSVSVCGGRVRSFLRCQGYV